MDGDIHEFRVVLSCDHNAFDQEPHFRLRSAGVVVAAFHEAGMLLDKEAISSFSAVVSWGGDRWSITS
jgi:hypothetical protein